MEKTKVYVVLSADNDGKDIDYYGDPLDKEGLIEGLYADKEKAILELDQLRKGHSMDNTIIYWMEEHKID